MPLLDHFHPPLHGPRRWAGFLTAWAALIAKQLNLETLPENHFAEPKISVGPRLEVDDVAIVKAPSQSPIVASMDCSRLDGCAIHVYRDLNAPQLGGAVELVSPANKEGAASRRSFAAKCIDHLKHGIGVVIVDVVTTQSANLHEELFAALSVKTQGVWTSATGLYAVAYRAVPDRKESRVEVWSEVLTLGEPLPTLPLWLALDLCVPLRLEESYVATCRSLRIPA
jgi:hypothetical protein